MNRCRNGMSAPSSSTYAATYGGLMRWPANGMLMMANVVTVPLSGSSTKLSSSRPVAGSASLRREVHLAVARRCERRAACRPPARAGTHSREAMRCAGFRCCSATPGWSPARGRRVIGHRFLPSPSAKYAMSVIAPTGSSTQCAWTRAPVLIASDESAATACRRAVSAPSSLISAHANGLSSGCPSSGSDCQVHDSTVPTLATGTTSVSRCIGHRVILSRRHEHPAVRAADAEDASPAQGGEELAEEWSD